MKKESVTYLIGFGVLGSVLLVGSLFVWNASMTIDSQAAEAEEAKRPAEIDLTLITPTECDLCVDGTILLQEIEKQDVRLLGSETLTQDSDEALELIETYEITRLPAIIVLGEYDKQNVQAAFESLSGEQRDDALVIEVQQPVYVDLTTGETTGLIDITYLADSSCSDCYEPVSHKTILENNFGITIQSENTVDANSPEGRALIEQYAITQVPTVLLSAQSLAYDRLGATWQQVGSIEEDGVFVFRKNSALGSVVYKDLDSGEIIRPESSEE